MKKRIKVQNYFAIFEPAEEGGFNVSFPDFPGCVTFGKNFEHAKEMAKEVLELWIEELNANRQLIPKRVFRPIVDEIEVNIAVI
ncbi:MAG: type II toxin-antitoxin system HicB family antitoxin [Patescibacteria group bacterium]